MAILGNPFVGNVTKQMSTQELAQALMVDLADEYETIITYQSHMMATSDQRALKVLRQITDEERQHIGELQQLLNVLSPTDMEKMEKGKQKVLQVQQSNFQAPMPQ